MAIQIEAVFEHGVFRPLKPVNLNEGEHVDIVLLRRQSSPAGKRPAELLAEIAALPLESPADGFSGLDQSEALLEA